MKDFKWQNKELYVISNDASYKDLFESIEEFSTVVRLPKIEERIHCQAIFVDGKSISASELKTIRGFYPNLTIFYLLADIQNQILLKNTMYACSAYTVQPLSEDMTREQIKEELKKHLFDKAQNQQKRTVAFFGTHSGAGVSTMVMNVADLLVKTTENSVLLLSLNPWDTADYFLEYKGRHLNDLKIDLKTKSLTEEKIMNSIYKYPNSFYHLAGNLDIKLQRFFKIEEIEYLLERCRNMFDVVLVDGGPHFDNACYAQAFRESDLRFLVTTQEPKGYLGYWPHIYEQLLEPLGAQTHDFLLLLNQFTPENTLATERDIAEQLNMSILSTIPSQDILGSSSITQKKLLHENGASKEFKDSLMAIVHGIIAQYGLKKKEQEENASSKKIFARLFAR